MKITQVNNGGGGGAAVVVLAAAVLAAVAGLSWMGKHAAEINAGVRALVEVAVTMVITAGIAVCVAVWYRRRQAAMAAEAAEREKPQPVTAVPEHMPVQLPAASPAELQPGGTTLHFPHASPAEVAELVEALKNRNNQP